MIVLVMSCMAVFLAYGSFERSAGAKEPNPYVSIGAFELGQVVGLGKSDLSVKFFLKDSMFEWDNSGGMAQNFTSSQLTSNLLVITPTANLVIGNIVSLDMELGYGDSRMDSGSNRASDESTGAEVVPQWRWFSSITLNSYHQVRGVDLHGRIGFNRLLMEDMVDLHPSNLRSSGHLLDQQQIDASLGLTLGRIEPFLGGLYAYKSARRPSLRERRAEAQNGDLTAGASLGLRGGVRFVIGEMSGGIVGSRRLRESGRGSNSLEGNIRIKF